MYSVNRIVNKAYDRRFSDLSREISFQWTVQRIRIENIDLGWQAEHWKR